MYLYVWVKVSQDHLMNDHLMCQALSVIWTIISQGQDALQLYLDYLLPSLMSYVNLTLINGLCFLDSLKSYDNHFVRIPFIKIKVIYCMYSDGIDFFFKFLLFSKCFSCVDSHYDWPARLVLALGAEAKLDLVPGAAEYALPFSTLDDALVWFWNCEWYFDFVNKKIHVYTLST